MMAEWWNSFSNRSKDYYRGSTPSFVVFNNRNRWQVQRPKM